LPRGGGAEECPNGAPDWWPGRLIATARAKRNFSIPHLLCERMPDPAPRRQDASGGGDSRRGTHGRDALVFRQRQLRVSSRKSAGGALGGCAREFPDAIGSRAGASSLPRASCIRPAREAALMARNEPDDELKAPSSVADICPERNSSTSIHRQRRAGEQEMVGPQSRPLIPRDVASTDNGRWSLYGAPWLQPVAISGKSRGRLNRRNKPEPRPPIADLRG
jgi:hypothetical protein